jgi:curved DNA-binding protein CbpA
VAKGFYELLDVAPDAPVDEIKRAFRREIAKYHPDKVQHLGKEFQEIAANKAAELTRAYKTLTDTGARAEYDEADEDGHPSTLPRPSPTPPSGPATAPSSEAGAHPVPESAPPSGTSVFQQDRAGANDLVQRATMMRFRTVLTGEFRSWEDFPLPGFQVTCTPKAAFWSLKLPPRILGRFVPLVDGASLSETWTMASRIPKDSQRELCIIFLMGPAIAPAGELAAAIKESQRRPTSTKLLMVPVNTRTWSAHVPTDAPPVVKSLLARLKSA